jgi:outer membrane protein assembly factor BamB
MKLDMLIILAGITYFAGCNDKDLESALKGCCGNQAIDEAVGNGHIYVGNIFTPNGDGINDNMAISTQGIDLIVEVEVRNKQGEKVFESTTVEVNSELTSWDGRVDGVVKEGVYTISISVLAADGTSRTLTGSVCNYPCDGEGNLESIPTDNCTFPAQADDGHFNAQLPSGEHNGCFE